MLKANNVSIYYGDIQVIFDISFTIEEKEIVSIIGANGAGKSTLLKAISGQVKIRAGSIQFEQEAINSLKSHEIVQKGITQVPEGRGIFHSLTVRENLEIGSYLKKSKQRQKESLNKVFDLFPRLRERQSQLAGTLSGGEQQMLALGRGIMSLPKLLLLDEPSLGLSPIILKHIFETITQIHQQGITVLLIEQNVFHSLNMADRGYILENGHLVLEGKGRDLLSNPHIRQAYLGI